MMSSLPSKSQTCCDNNNSNNDALDEESFHLRGIAPQQHDDCCRTTTATKQSQLSSRRKQQNHNDNRNNNNCSYNNNSYESLATMGTSAMTESATSLPTFSWHSLVRFHHSQQQTDHDDDDYDDNSDESVNEFASDDEEEEEDYDCVYEWYDDRRGAAASSPQPVHDSLLPPVLAIHAPASRILTQPTAASCARNYPENDNHHHPNDTSNTPLSRNHNQHNNNKNQCTSQQMKTVAAENSACGSDSSSHHNSKQRRHAEVLPCLLQFDTTTKTETLTMIFEQQQQQQVDQVQEDRHEKDCDNTPDRVLLIYTKDNNEMDQEQRQEQNDSNDKPQRTNLVPESMKLQGESENLNIDEEQQQQQQQPKRQGHRETMRHGSHMMMWDVASKETDLQEQPTILSLEEKKSDSLSAYTSNEQQAQTASFSCTTTTVAASTATTQPAAKKKRVSFGMTRVYEHAVIIGDNHDIECPLSIDWARSEHVLEYPSGVVYGYTSYWSNRSGRTLVQSLNTPHHRRLRIAQLYDLSVEDVIGWEQHVLSQRIQQLARELAVVANKLLLETSILQQQEDHHDVQEQPNQQVQVQQSRWEASIGRQSFDNDTGRNKAGDRTPQAPKQPQRQQLSSIEANGNLTNSSTTTSSTNCLLFANVISSPLKLDRWGEYPDDDNNEEQCSSTTSPSSYSSSSSTRFLPLRSQSHRIFLKYIPAPPLLSPKNRATSAPLFGMQAPLFDVPE